MLLLAFGLLRNIGSGVAQNEKETINKLLEILTTKHEIQNYQYFMIEIGHICSSLSAGKQTDSFIVTVVKKIIRILLNSESTKIIPSLKQLVEVFGNSSFTVLASIIHEIEHMMTGGLRLPQFLIDMASFVCPF